MQNFSYALKFIIIGDSGVGKTCLLLKFTDKRFKASHEVTIGVEYGTRLIKVGAETIKLQIWDTAGTESFRSITRAYYRGAAGALVMYDITKRQTFDNIKAWLNELSEFGSQTTTSIVIGSKADDEENREVSYTEGKHLAEQHGLAFIETSAVTGLNIDNAFTVPAKQIMDKVEQGFYDLSSDTTGIRAAGNLSSSLSTETFVPDLKKKKCAC
mmetsp:Transcript_28066/g.50271  ORF Transcript_28066/g.50271 Transcript_28066/m.50271 type:complete len:213 (+) Transcript_28066:793-1431(+)